MSAGIVRLREQFACLQGKVCELETAQGGDITADSITIFTNKSLSGSDNTFTNISYTSLVDNPTSLSGYGITDGVSTGESYANPSWITSLAYSKLSGAPTIPTNTDYVDRTTAQTIAGLKTFNGSFNAAGLIARGLYLTPTLIATANNDVLVALDIAPTFTNGAFTGVTNYGLRVGHIISALTSTYDIGTPTNKFSSVYATQFLNPTSGAVYGVTSSATIGFRLGGSTSFAGGFQSNGNFFLQSPAAFPADSGFRCNITGTFRATGQVTFGTADIHADNAAAVTAGKTAGMLYKTATGQAMIVL
jgi:hypothetical protein